MDNPFLKLLQEQAQNNPTQGGQPPMMEQGAPMASSMGSMGTMGQETPPPDVSQPGQTADATKPLMQAMQALHNYIAQSTDKQDIAIVRSLIALLTKVIQRDQEKSFMADQQAEQTTPPLGEQPISQGAPQQVGGGQ